MKTIRDSLRSQFGIAPVQRALPAFSVRYSLDRALASFVTRYAAKQLQMRWVTIGADDGEGGTPVQLDGDGKIQKGPGALAGKTIGELDRGVKGTEKDRRGHNFNPATKRFESTKDKQPDTKEPEPKQTEEQPKQPEAKKEKQATIFGTTEDVRIDPEDEKPKKKPKAEPKEKQAAFWMGLDDAPGQRNFVEEQEEEDRGQWRENKGRESRPELKGIRSGTRQEDLMTEMVATGQIQYSPDRETWYGAGGAYSGKSAKDVLSAMNKAKKLKTLSEREKELERDREQLARSYADAGITKSLDELLTERAEEIRKARDAVNRSRYSHREASRRYPQRFRWTIYRGRPAARYHLARALGISVSRYRTGKGMGESGGNENAEWKTVGGARALIDVETGSILAGCPGLEGEDLDEIGENEDPENRRKREGRQKKAEHAGYEPERQKTARQAWDEAVGEAPDADVVLVRVGDDYWAFGDHAKLLKEHADFGDGEVAEFSEGAFARAVSHLSVDAGLQVAVAEPDARDMRHFSANMPDDRILDDLDRQRAKEADGKKPRKRRMSQLDESVAEWLDTDNLEDIDEFKAAVNHVWKRLVADIQDENYGLRQVINHFASRRGGAGRLVAQVRKAGDADQIPAFDELVEFAQRSYPHVLAPPTGESGWSPEEGLFSRIQQGIQKPPARNSEEVMRAAGNLLNNGWTPEYQWNDIPYYAAKRSRRWRKVLYRASQARAAARRRGPGLIARPAL